MYRLKIFSLLLGAIFIINNLFAQQNAINVQFPDTVKSLEKEGGTEWVIKGFGNILTYQDSPVMITYPENFQFQDTGLLKLYFIGSSDKLPFPRNVFVLVGNYKSSTPSFFVDFNFNLDFSDDGPGKILSKDDSVYNFTLHNAKDSNATFTYALSRKKFHDSNVKARIKQQFKGREHIASVDYWFSDRRLNCKVTSTKINGKVVKIGIKDYNCNGYFNDSLKNDHDRVMIANTRKGKLSYRLSEGAYIADPGKVIKINEAYFRLDEVHPYGNFIKLRPTNESLNRLTVGDTIPEFKVKTLNKDTMPLMRKIANKGFTLLDIWGSWCKGCKMDLPELKTLNKDYPERLQIVGLNWGDSREEAMYYIRKNDINWYNAMANQQVLNRLLVDGYPYYVLLAPGGRIVALNTDFKEIKKLLNQ